MRLRREERLGIPQDQLPMVEGTADGYADRLRRFMQDVRRDSGIE